MGKRKLSSSGKNGLFVQAGILAAAGMISRVIGLLYTSPLTAIIGDEGNGYYSTAYAFYSIVLLISSYSIPSAMSKIVSQKLALGEHKNAQRIFYCSLIYVCIVGGIGSSIVFFGAGIFVDGYSVPVLRVFAPTIFVFGLLGVLRGYFQAHRTMVPTSISQLLEQIMNAAVSIGAAVALIGMYKGSDESVRAMNGAIGSAIGTGSGVLIALIFMYCLYIRKKPEISELVEQDTHEDMPFKEIFKLIITIVTPFILSTFIYNVSTTMNSTMFTKILIYYKGIAASQANTDYGIFARKAMVIANFPIALASAVAAAAMPDISTSYAQGKKEYTAGTVARCVRMVMIIAIPSAFGLLFLAKPVLMILFPQKSSLDQAGFLLQLLAITIITYSLSTVTNAVLQGIGRVNIPVVNAVIALVIQTAVLGVLLVFTNVGSAALAIAAIVYSTMMCVLNSHAVKRDLRVKIDYFKTYIIPAISGAAMGVIAIIVYIEMCLVINRITDRDYFVNLISVLIAIFVAVLVYTFLMVRFEGVTESELRGFPRGNQIIRILKKTKILK